MNLIDAARVLTRHLEETLPEWAAAADENDPDLPEVYAEANAVLDPDRRILTHETLDDLFALIASATDPSLDPNPRNPGGSPRRETESIRRVHDYVEDLNLALLRAGYPGDRLVADSLEDITATA